MSQSKKKSTIKNMLIMGVYQSVTVVVGFIVPKLLLSTYGAEIHGYTSTVTTIMSYIALLNAGLSSAAVQSLYAPLAKRNQKQISASLKAIDQMYMKTGFLYIIAVVCCAAVLPFIIKSGISQVQIFGLMLVMGASNTMECFIYSKYRVLLQADQKLYVVTIGDIAALVVRCILQVILINHKASILLVQLVPLCMVFLRMFIVASYCRKFYILDRNVKPDYSAVSNRKPAFVHQIASLVVNNTDTIILTILSSLTQVSIYSVYNLVCAHINSLISYVFQHSVVASFGHLYSDSKREHLNSVFRTYEYIYMMVISIVFSATAVLLYPFVDLYTNAMKEIQYANFVYTCLFVCVGLANNIRIPCLMLINATGMFKETQRQAILEAVLNITISLCLVKKMGISGLLIGTLVSFLYRTTDIILFSSKNILKESSAISLRRSLRTLVVILITYFLCSKIINISMICSWNKWILTGIISTCIASITTCILNYVFERKEFINTIHYVLGK